VDLGWNGNVGTGALVKPTHGATSVTAQLQLCRGLSILSQPLLTVHRAAYTVLIRHHPSSTPSGRHIRSHCVAPLIQEPTTGGSSLQVGRPALRRNTETAVVDIASDERKTWNGSDYPYIQSNRQMRTPGHATRPFPKPDLPSSTVTRAERPHRLVQPQARYLSIGNTSSQPTAPQYPAPPAPPQP
jgi:hypothetical protein